MVTGIQHPKFRVRAGSLELLNENGEVRQVRPATEQEAEMWQGWAATQADLKSANVVNEALRAALDDMSARRDALIAAIAREDEKLREKPVEIKSLHAAVTEGVTGVRVDTHADIDRWDNESPVVPRLARTDRPSNPPIGTILDINGDDMQWDGKHWNALPDQLADPAGDNDGPSIQDSIDRDPEPHWSDTTHD